MDLQHSGETLPLCCLILFSALLVLVYGFLLCVADKFAYLVAFLVLIAINVWVSFKKDSLSKVGFKIHRLIFWQLFDVKVRKPRKSMQPSLKTV